MVVSCTGIKQTLNQLLIHAEQGGGKERLRWLRGKGIREKKRTKKETNVTESIWLSLFVSHPQKLLVGDFPHELEVDEMEEDVPKRKNRTKARVRHQ